MEKAINRKKVEISELIAEYQELVNLHSAKVSEYLKNEFYFKRIEEDLNDLDNFEKLKQFYFDLGIEFRKFVMECNIKHNLIKEKTINIFLKQKPFGYLLSEKQGEELINDNNVTEMNNEEEKKSLVMLEKINKIKNKKHSIV